MNRTPSSIENLGVWVDGTLVLRWVQSTVLASAVAWKRSPVTFDSNTPSPSHSHIGKYCTRPEGSSW